VAADKKAFKGSEDHIMPSIAPHKNLYRLLSMLRDVYVEEGLPYAEKQLKEQIKELNKPLL
jgi:hypothetical protein